MSTNRPDTLDEWQDHVASLSGESLRSKAIAANSYRFVETLQDEGYPAADITAIFKMIARQFLVSGQEPVGSGYVDYRSLIAEDPELSALYANLSGEDSMARQRLTQTLTQKWGTLMSKESQDGLAGNNEPSLVAGNQAKVVAKLDSPTKSKTLVTARASSGLYGYPKFVQAACDSANRKLKKTALKIVRSAYQKDARVIQFLTTHQERTASTPAGVLLAAIREAHQVFGSLGVEAGRPAKTAGKPKYGLYGYRHRTAALGLAACQQLREEAGVIAADLHMRKSAMHDRITGFLTKHATEAQCSYSQLLKTAYPAAEMRLASKR